MDENDKSWLNNREKKKQPKPGLFWCWGCDANLVGENKKCEVCGTRNMGSRLRRNKK